MRVAMLHNLETSQTHETTVLDKANLCRRLLYHVGGVQETASPSPTTYQWKKDVETDGSRKDVQKVGVIYSARINPTLGGS